MPSALAYRSLRRVASARSIDEVLLDEDVAASIEAGAVLFAVPLLADAGRTVRINISLDKAKRLIELHRAVVARESKTPKKYSPN